MSRFGVKGCCGIRMFLCHVPGVFMYPFGEKRVLVARRPKRVFVAFSDIIEIVLWKDTMI